MRLDIPFLRACVSGKGATDNDPTTSFGSRINGDTVNQLTEELYKLQHEVKDAPYVKGRTLMIYVISADG
ncbi:hypothetical protein [Paenibacillus silviterrae]|uniref:hypothetical protein n=1 Tax=Paenibacillus silviterrae TaxID=3242194 RepID=UPI002543A4E6|nr:hypothetical protein [Paenibacillus chinjuensis]